MPEEKKETEVNLEWRDYVAVVIAALQTTLLPFIVVIVVLLVLWFVIRR